MMSRKPALHPPAGDSTADAILDAAERLFASQGFARTTIKTIGREAGVNPALLYYYFEDKTGLYRAVLGRIGAGLRGRAVPAIKAARSVDELVAGIIAAQSATLVRHPHAARLLIREMLDHDAAHAQGMMQELGAELFRPVCDAIEAGKRAGTVRADLDPKLAAISTISQLIYFTLALPAIRVLMNKASEYPDPDDRAAFVAHATDFAAAAMSPRGDG